MSLFYLEKFFEAFSSPAAPASGLASSQVTQQVQVPTNAQAAQSSRLQWSAHAPPSGQSLSPLLRDSHTLSTSASTGELILFGGFDFSTTLLKTSGDVPSPRYGHAAVFTSNILLIWGGFARQQNAPEQTNDNSLYLLNFVSREWTRIMVNSLGPGGRFGHSMTLIGSKLFVFGGWSFKGLGSFNDIWALDYLKSNPFWVSYEPSGNEKPLPRTGHVSVTTDGRIIIFGGLGKQYFNDTWSFDISTRKWTELQCTGSIPSPRVGHAAVLLGDVMYVFGGRSHDGVYLGDLTALNLSTQRWIAFQNIGPSPRARSRHAMAYDGTRVFVLGGLLSPDAQADETKPIHILDTKHVDCPGPDSDVINSSEKTTQLVQKSSASPPIGRQPHQSSSSSDAHLAYHASPSHKATPEELDHPASQQVTREGNPSLNNLVSRPTSASGRPGRVPEKDDDSEGSTERHAELVAPDEKEIARLEDRRPIELEQQLSEAHVAKTERDRRIGQLTDELALKSARLAQAAEENKRTGLELRELQARLDESLMSRDHALEQAQSALHKASRAAESDEQSQRELTETRAELEASRSESVAFRLRLADLENDCAKSKAEADAYRNQNETGFVNTDEDRVVHRLMERIRALEAEVASLPGSEKSFEMMECRNED